RDNAAGPCSPPDLQYKPSRLAPGHHAYSTSPDRSSCLRFRSSLASRSRPLNATSSASFTGTAITPSSSATITSPGFTARPAQTTGTLTEPRVALTVPLAEIARDQTGKPISFKVLTSRHPASMTRPTAPLAFSDVA